MTGRQCWRTTISFNRCWLGLPSRRKMWVGVRTIGDEVKPPGSRVGDKATADMYIICK